MKSVLIICGLVLTCLVVSELSPSFDENINLDHLESLDIKKALRELDSLPILEDDKD